ncbi:hypothetical protein [Corynebacterium pygosceleis]|uniref:Uncharacterized protein n=1 Tax=Corynebacterium pygosceleis TaxID=2800406 RepID=A0A9Q4GHE0_9CORY|nr:hypothetical protein [Corynebacterium pygosceleis]MCK7636545.1 hypothetical protein [Corynebacterium pygosceleis]MCK7675119.1 hypothetical protein [Corynebacterium pygosceleis]MCL0120679.1 hypothetical protein [Corynebacterium pygosceleis]MCX7444219.1 hypothetical protein [Corynebacterium pygosceleis]MCX7467298.1 hypothetical protein [Corynebacterium pygosceleis]
MENLTWGPRETSDGHTTLSLSLGDRDVAVFGTEPVDDHRATVEGAEWRLSAPKSGPLRATLPDGRVFTATPDKPRLARARTITVDFAGESEAVFVNEARTDWVIESSDGTKLGQFSGANHGVRRVVVEMEPDAELPLDRAVFSAWVSRTALEAKMISSTVVLTVSLLLLTPFIIWFFLN